MYLTVYAGPTILVDPDWYCGECSVLFRKCVSLVGRSMELILKYSNLTCLPKIHHGEDLVSEEHPRHRSWKLGFSEQEQSIYFV